MIPGLGLVAVLALLPGTWTTAFGQSQGTVRGVPLDLPIAPTVTFTLPDGTRIELDFNSSISEAAPNGQRIQVELNLSPVPPNDAARGSLGGGDVVPVGPPIDIHLFMIDTATGKQVAWPSDINGDALVKLPVLKAPANSDQQFAWLREVRVNGAFAGYFRDAATFDAGTNSLIVHVPVGSLAGTLFLPVMIIPAYVANFDSATHILSSPFSDAVDFGVAGPQFTHFKVVGPQVIARIYVFDTATNGYGWIDASGVGPVAGPS